VQPERRWYSSYDDRESRKELMATYDRCEGSLPRYRDAESVADVRGDISVKPQPERKDRQ